MMTSHDPDCLGHYEFDQIVFFARKRFIEGCDTISLLQQAASERERQEIALIALLDVDDEHVRDLKLSCVYAGQCKVTNCRDKLRTMIERALAVQDC